MRKEPADYLAYMLRLWRASAEQPDDSTGVAGWRASLESPQTGERIGFGSLLELFAFLEQEVSRRSAAEAPPAERGSREQHHG